MRTIINLHPVTQLYELWAKSEDTDWTYINGFETWEEATKIKNEMLETNELHKGEL
jgi:hypothetical protein